MGALLSGSSFVNHRALYAKSYKESKEVFGAMQKISGLYSQQEKKRT